jgi:amidophosphoribosyltransferase
MSGLFGVVSNNDNCSQALFYGTDYHSHLGTEFGGLAVLGEKFHHKIHAINQTQFKSKFFEDYHQMNGKKGIGAISDTDENNLYALAFGSFFIVTAGLIENKEDLVQTFWRKEYPSANQPHRSQYIRTYRQAYHNRRQLDPWHRKHVRKIRGSCSLLILHEDGIYAARDRKGYTPLALGKNDGMMAVASETTAFTNLGFENHQVPGSGRNLSC